VEGHPSSAARLGMGAEEAVMSASAKMNLWADGGRWAHFVHVTRALTTTEFKLRYFGSVLGYFWTLLRPLMLFGVLYVVFTHVVRFGGKVPHYPVVLLAAIVMFNFFGEATSGGLGSFVARENLLRKVYFPRAAVPISVSFTAAANLALGVVVVLLFAFIDGVTPSPRWLLFLGAVLSVIGLATAVSLLLAVLFVRYRDMQPIWEVALQLLFWGTPIIYTIKSVPGSVRELVMMSPLAVAIQQGRHWLVPRSTESAGQAIGGTVRLLIPLAISIAIVFLSWWAYRRAEPRMAEDL
jgi:ABC-2 type transport system permease protein